MKKYTFILLFLFILPVAVLANGSEVFSPSEPTMKFALWAFILGGLSAVSLPLGSLLGIVWRPKPKITATFTAFGAGALLAALSVELIAPTIMEAIGEISGAGEAAHNSSYSTKLVIYLIAGCVAGGFFFYFLNEALDSKGGYLRKVSTTITHLNHMKYHRLKNILSTIGKSSVMVNIPNHQLQNLVKYLRFVTFEKGTTLVREGEMGERMFIIEEGTVESWMNGKVVKTEGAGDLICETALFLEVPYKASIIAATDLKAFELSKENFDKIRAQSPNFNELVGKLAQEEDAYEDGLIKETEKTDEGWTSSAINELHLASSIPTMEEVKHAEKGHSNAGLSIWLGILLDGLPESFVIGAGFLMLLSRQLHLGEPSFQSVIPYTLIAGLFLSNFPEAMSSSISMKNMGYKMLKILMLWTSLMIITALGAVVGYYYGSEVPELIEVAIEGLAAGAMLTMIAQTMIPEAVHIGGHHVVGLSTLAGYLSAVAFKLFE